MKNGYKLKTKCKDCGVTFEWSVLPTQLLTAKMAEPSRSRRAGARAVVGENTPLSRVRARSKFLLTLQLTVRCALPIQHRQISDRPSCPKCDSFMWAFPMGEMPAHLAISRTIWRCLKCDHEWISERPVVEPSSVDRLLGDQPSCPKCGDLKCTTLVNGTLAPPDSLLMEWCCLACDHEWTDEHTTGAPSCN